MTDYNRITFITQASHCHKDRYDYTKIGTVQDGVKVTITCKIHGDFTQLPAKHVSGQGCPVCGGSKKHTIDTFIARATEKHGFRYNYDRVIYVNNKTKIVIECPEHGDFTQTAGDHIYGKGCPDCGGVKRLTTETFIVKATAKHNGKYNYDKVTYKDNKTKVVIECPVHGDFTQTPNSHLKGRGCMSCCKVKKYTTQTFVEKAMTIHGDKYDYSRVLYENATQPIILGCYIHGYFEQMPPQHLQGHGCGYCGGNMPYTTEMYIEKARTIHGDKYNYDNVIYSRAHDKICIGCPKHGNFTQKAYSHIYGSGCPTCNESSLESAVANMLSSMKVEYVRQYKIADCRNISPLPFDFYIPLYNTLIECDGIQHFEPVDFFGGEVEFEKRRLRDYIKTEYCNENNITLLRIPYSMSSDDILLCLMKMSCCK